VMDRNIVKGGSGEVFKGGIWEQVEFARLKETGAKWTDDSGVKRVSLSITCAIKD
jgi:hypothetical protein